MFGVGQVMSGAIVDQFPEKFEGEKPAKTGMGGMSETNSRAILWSFFGLSRISSDEIAGKPSFIPSYAFRLCKFSMQKKGIRGSP
jgi:hypothetical protein